MSETVKALGALMLLIVVLPVTILSIADRLRYKKRRITIEEREIARKAWTDRLRRPQFEEVEKVCGGLLPTRLRRAYQEMEIPLAKNIGFGPPKKDSEKHFYWIYEFVPMDAEGQANTADLSEFGCGCCFAGDGMGNFYWTSVSVSPQDDAPVYFACHDPYGNEKVAESLQEFFGWLEAAIAKSKNSTN